MKIISKFKDYYDYLQGIYGIDTNLVLDRTNFSPIPYKPSDFTVSTIIICDYMVQGLWVGEKIYYGEEIEQFIDKNNNRCYGLNDEEYHIYNDNSSIKYVLKKPKLLIDSPCYKLKCPILFAKRYNGNEIKDFENNPILKEYFFHKVFMAEEIWLMLSEFLGKLKNPNIVDNQSNKEKIVSHGFDLKSSFRH